MNHGLDGFQTYELAVQSDERGFFVEALRKDWAKFLDVEWISQINLSHSYPGVVRAWHRHRRGQIDYLVVLRGAMKICAYDDQNHDTMGYLAEIVSSEKKLQIVKIPGHYWHGTRTLGNKSSLALYFVTRLFDYGSPDEERRPWNDSRMVPTMINGKINDPRVGKPWDWFLPLHK